MMTSIEHDRELGLEQMLERLARRSRRHQGRVDAAKDGAIGQQLGRLIIDQQDADVVAWRGDAGPRCSIL